MDTIEIASVALEGVRLDFPSEKQMAALASAWDDDANHQISFLSSLDFRAAQQTSEYASMIASADLVLGTSVALSRRAAEIAEAKGAMPGGTITRSIPIGPRRIEYLSYFGSPEDDDELFHPYLPLKTLSLFLSALEQRRGSAFLIGGNFPVLQKAEMNLRSTFPEIRVVGRATGDYGGEDEMVIMRALQKAVPDMIIVGSMVKDTELWVARHMRYTRSGIFFYERSIMEILAGRP